MTALAPLLQAFFRDRLLRQRRASAHTVMAYRDTFRLLLGFAQPRLGRSPTDLRVADLDASLIVDFLHHPRRLGWRSTRNARLAAIQSFFDCRAAPARSSPSDQRSLAIPQKKRTGDWSVPHPPEIETLPPCPIMHHLDRTATRRLVVALHTGLRVSELTAARRRCRHASAHVRCIGKGAGTCTPLTGHQKRATGLREGQPAPRRLPFPSRRGGPLTRRRRTAVTIRGRQPVLAAQQT
jgi:integrase